ncbi:MAG: hypothetical protein MJ196_11030 [Treponemataceae bacterium]|nr:hypothetical protein [Treponemataceae bacterium]
MKSGKKSLGTLVLQIALGLFLLTFGILTLQLDSGFFGKLSALVTGNEVAIAVNSFIKGDAATIVIILLGVCELVAGVGLLLDLFVSMGKLANIFNLIVLVAWIAVIIVIDIMGPGGLAKGAFKSLETFLWFLKSLSSHLLVLGALLTLRKY